MQSAFLAKQQGFFSLSSETNNLRSLVNIKPGQIKSLASLTFTGLCEFKAEHLAGLTTLEKITYVNDQMAALYLMYLFIFSEKQSNGAPTTADRDGYLEAYSQISRDIRQTIPELDMGYIKTLLESDKLDKATRQKMQAIVNSDGNISYNTLEQIRDDLNANRSERALILAAYENFLVFKKLKALLSDTNITF